MKNSAVGAEVGNKHTIDHALTEASTSVIDSKANDHENVEEDAIKPEKDAHPVSNVVKHSKECSLCKKVYHSRSGLHKHMKTHRLDHGVLGERGCANSRGERIRSNKYPFSIYT
jgi:hypothetical protein